MNLTKLETKSSTSVLERMESTSSGIPLWTDHNLQLLCSEWLRSGTCPLSPYPKSYEENMRWRAKILRRCKEDQVFRQRVKKLFYSDILFAYNLFFWTLDVRRKPYHHRPFATYWYQDLAILNLCAAIEEQHDLLIEKSRDMGASWIFVGTYSWYWLRPEGGFDFLFGSRIEDYVDKKGDMRTLFEKVRYLFYRLPRWLRPRGFKTNVHDNYMKVVNPKTCASLTGESNNANFGTGGRYSGVLLDEFPKWERTDEAAWTSLGDATPSRHAIGTPFGAGGTHYELANNGRTRKLIIHWSLHPRKGRNLACVWPRPRKSTLDVGFFNWRELTSPWYAKEKERRKPKELAQELDIDYIGAGSVVFDNEALVRILELRNVEKPILQIFSVDYDVHELIPVDSTQVDDLDGFVVMYSEPTTFSLEVGGVDVAEGKEDGDYSVMKVMERHSRSLSFSFFSQCSEVMIAKVIHATSKYIQRSKKDPLQYPWWVIETIGPGISTFDLCVEWGVTKMFMMPRFDSAKQSTSFTKGIRTSSVSKNVGIAKVRTWLEECHGWVDPRCLKEMTTFVRNKNGKPGAKESCNDDEVMAWLLAVLGDSYLPAVEYQEPETYATTYQKAQALAMREPPKVEEPTLVERAISQINEKKKLAIIEFR